ncbi:hypothetical protein CLOP_g23005, partial [Closterium sp. NIES-67]
MDSEGAVSAAATGVPESS